MLIGALAQGVLDALVVSNPLWRALWAQIELYRDDTAWPARELPPDLLPMPTSTTSRWTAQVFVWSVPKKP